MENESTKPSRFVNACLFNVLFVNVIDRCSISQIWDWTISTGDEKPACYKWKTYQSVLRGLQKNRRTYIWSSRRSCEAMEQIFLSCSPNFDRYWSSFLLLAWSERRRDVHGRRYFSETNSHNHSIDCRRFLLDSDLRSIQNSLRCTFNSFTWKRRACSRPFQNLSEVSQERFHSWFPGISSYSTGDTCRSYPSSHYFFTSRLSELIKNCFRSWHGSRFLIILKCWARRPAYYTSSCSNSLSDSILYSNFHLIYNK